MGGGHPRILKFGIAFTKPQSSIRWTGIGYFHEPGGESYLAITIMAYELAIGMFDPEHLQ